MKLHENKEEKVLTAKRTFASVLEHWFSVVVIDGTFFFFKIRFLYVLGSRIKPHLALHFLFNNTAIFFSKT